MRFRNQKFIKRLLAVIWTAFLVLSVQSVYASGKENPLNRAQKSIERAEKIAKKKTLREELKKARKTIAEARKEFKKKNQKKAYEKIKGIARTLQNLLIQSRDKSEMLQNALNSTLENLYAAIRQLGGYRVTTETGWGLHISVLETLQGVIKFNLPREMFADDKILGTVTVLPVGKTEEERIANLNALNGYAIETTEIKDMQFKVSQRKKAWLMPKSLEVINLIFKDEFGIEAGRTKIPVHPKPSVLFPAKKIIEPTLSESYELKSEHISTPEIEPVSLADFQLPKIGQIGIPFQIFGPFDSNLNNTRVRINGQDADILTEFPRGLIAQSPPDIRGSAEILLMEGDIVIQNKINIITLILTAPKLSLRRGEQTTLTVTVEGLKGFEEDLPLHLQNFSPEIIQMEGGNSQNFSIHPEEYKYGGIYSLNRRLTGVRPGNFKITASIPIDLINSAVKLGSYAGEKYRMELTDEEKELLLNMPKADYIEFMKKDLNVYATKEEYSDTSELVELSRGLQDYLSQIKPEDQGWIADIYVGTVLKVLRKAGPYLLEEVIQKYIWENIDLLQKPSIKKK